jgi:hypothetical protein
VVLRGYKGTNIRVPRNRVLRGAKLKCPLGTCAIRQIRVRYVIGNKVYNGVGIGPKTVPQGKTVLLRSVMPRGLYRRLKKGKVSGTVTFIVVAKSSEGGRTVTAIRTGLKR